MRYLSADEIWRVHLRVARHAEQLGKPFLAAVREPELLASAAGQPRQSFGGADLYRTVFDKAAALARGIICGHMFVDGNKRTGLAAVRLFLEYNGWDFDLPDEELEALALVIAGAREQGQEPIAITEISERLRSASRSTDR